MCQITALILSTLLICSTWILGISITSEIPLLEIRYDYNQTSKLSDLYLFIEPAITLHFNETDQIESAWVLEPVEPALKDRALDDLGLFIKELKWVHSQDNWKTSFGKFNPTFGTMWNIGPGIWGRKGLPEEYEIAEKVGISGHYGVNLLNNTHTLEASLFKADQSSLGNSSLLTDRGKQDDSVTQTKGFESYALSITGTLEEQGLSYQMAYRHLAKGPMPNNDSGFSIGLDYQTTLNNIKINPVAEYVRLSNMDGGNKRVSYVSLGTTLQINKWSMAISQTRKGSDYQNQLSMGYTYSKSMIIDFGWKQISTVSIKENSIGSRINIKI